MKIENAMMQPRTAERHMSEARCNGWNAIGAFRFDETTTGAQRPESKEASDMIENRAVGRRIASLRQEHSLTQQQLAAMLRVSHQAVSKWESGQALPDIQTMLELTQFFGVTVEQLLNGVAEPERATEAEERCAEVQQSVDAGEAPGEEKHMNIQQLLQMAPFMSKEGVEEIAMKLEGGVTAMQLARLAPFVRPECVEALLAKYQPQMNWDALRRLAPFMSRESVDKLARAIANGEATVQDSGDAFNKTINDIGKAFDDIGKGVGQAFDGLGKGMEKVVRKAWRFGENVVNEVSNAFNDLTADAPEPGVERVRSERAQQIRKKAFERALEDGKWDWLAAHISEIADDAELKARIAAKANEQGMHAWVCENLEGYADGDIVESAIAEGKWDWLGDNAWQLEDALQQRVARAAADAENWQWLLDHAVQLKLDDCAAEIAGRALNAGQNALAAQLASTLPSEQAADLGNRAYETGNYAALELLLPSCGEAFADALLRDLAEKQDWAHVEQFIRCAAADTVEQLMETAVEQGNFEAVDMLDQHL